MSSAVHGRACFSHGRFFRCIGQNEETATVNADYQGASAGLAPDGRAERELRVPATRRIRSRPQQKAASCDICTK